MSGVLASLLLVLIPAGPASAFVQPVDCQGYLSLGGFTVSFGTSGSSTIYPANYSLSLAPRYKWEPGDYIRVGGQRSTGTTLEIWLDDDLVASGPYPTLTYTFTKRQIAYLKAVLNSSQAEPQDSCGLLIACPE
jgi:hypothetical protein